MDFQNRAGGKTGSGGVASWSESNRDRRERLRQLALETIDLNKVNIFHSLRRWFRMCARACFNSRALLCMAHDRTCTRTLAKIYEHMV